MTTVDTADTPHKARARLASAYRWKKGAAAVRAAASDLATINIELYVRKMLAEYGPLSDDQIARINVQLRPPAVDR